MALEEADKKRKLVNALCGKVQGGQFSKYLRAIIFEDLKQLKNVEIRFEFPVTAIAGRNGTGKTTILASAAASYSESNRALHQHRYFINMLLPRTNWDKVAGKIIYRYQEKGESDSEKYLKCVKKWRGYPNQPNRQVRYFGNTRLTPKAELRRFAVFQQQKFSKKIGEQIPQTVVTALNGILGMRYENIRAVKHYGTKLFIGMKNGKRISEFHWGAGESNVLLMVMEIDALPDGSLILIDEIENAMHPEALSQFIKYLIRKADQNEIQTIFTTHSRTALEVLPAKGRWFLNHDNRETTPIMGIHPDYAFGLLSGKRSNELQIIVEDEISKGLLTEILNTHDSKVRSRVDIRHIGDMQTVLHAYKYVTKLGHKGIAVLDGDANLTQEMKIAFEHEKKESLDQLESGVFQLPEGVPEELLVQTIKKNPVDFEQRLGRDREVSEFISQNDKKTSKDFLRDLALKLDKPKETIIENACLVWTIENKINTKGLFEKIKGAIEE